VRRRVCSQDLDEVLRRRLTVPLLIPCELEVYLNDLTGHTLDEWISPVYDVNAHAAGAISAVIPPLPETTDGAGNLRYWTNPSEGNYWRGEKGVEVSEVNEVLCMLCSATQGRMSCCEEEVIKVVREFVTAGA